MVNVYVDEAGTSEREQVSIVVGIGVDSPETRARALGELSKIVCTYVPRPLQEGFVFHATDIWNDSSHRQYWTMQERLSLLYAMMSLPRKLGLPIHLGMVRRNAPQIAVQSHISQARLQHAIAFSLCVAKASAHARHQYGNGVTVSVVAEDVAKMRGRLTGAAMAMKEEPIHVPDECLRPTLQEQANGVITQSGELSASSLESVSYVGKNDEPLLQLADACAFALRRRFENQSFGREFVEAMVVDDLIEEDYKGPASGVTLWSPLW